MGGEKPKSDQPETREDYETTVIDFLDQEITASAKPTDDQNTAPDELDTLVANLLKEVITAADEEDSSPKIRVGVPITRVSEATVSGIAEVEQSHQRLPGPAVLQPERCFDAAAKEPEAKGVAGRTPAFVLSQSRPVPSKRGLLISVALVCLLASIGFGIYRFTVKQTTVPVNRQLTSTAPLKTGPDAPMQSSQDSRAEAQPPLAQPTGAAGRGTSAAIESGKPSSPATPLRAVAPAQAQSSRDSRKETTNSPVAPSGSGEVKPDRQAVSNKAAAETTQSQQISPAPSPTAPAVSPVAPAEKPAPPAPAAVENPVVTRQPEKVDIAASLPAVPFAPEPRPAQPGLGATNRVDSAPSSNPQPIAAPVPSVVSPPVAISKVNPTYPEAARRMRITGTVVLDLSIDANGKVTRANLVSGESVLAYVAIDAVKKWRYKPALVNGKSVPGAARVSIVFNP